MEKPCQLMMELGLLVTLRVLPWIFIACQSVSAGPLTLALMTAPVVSNWTWTLYWPADTAVAALVTAHLNKHPGSVTALLCLAEIQRHQGQADQARQTLLTVLALEPGNQQAKKGIGE